MRILSQQQSDALRSWLHQFSATHVPRSVQTFHGDLRRRMGTQSLLRASTWRTSHTYKRTEIHTEGTENSGRNRRNAVR